MGYKLRDLPSTQASDAELADYMEYQCLVSDEKSYSTTSGNSSMGILYDDNTDAGIEGNEINYDFSEALAEVDDRENKSKGKYPFVAEVDTIKIKDDVESYIIDIYTFLLLATRENMKGGKIANDLDGTELFEQLCATVVKNYFGPNSKSFVFGTGAVENKPFHAKVQDFLDTIHEGKYIFRKPDGDVGQQKDGKIDVVIFIPFADNNKGQFMGFGQCKTGTNWKASISQLIPSAFSESFIQPPLAFIPITLFFVSESFTDKWEELTRLSRGIIFDRNRIMEYIPDNIDAELLNKIRRWNEGVISRDQR